MLRIDDIVKYLEQIAPTWLAEDGDKIGLQLGGLNNRVKKVFVTVDCTANVVNTAIKENIDLIISHHPLIYNPIKNLCETDPEICNIINALKAGISVYVMHTNYDSATNGINDILASTLDLQNTSILFAT
ncbi:MAG: Nif3-like dinuclear metal center hexameric protein, partial [Armatimonadota bacterium]